MFGEPLGLGRHIGELLELGRRQHAGSANGGKTWNPVVGAGFHGHFLLLIKSVIKSKNLGKGLLDRACRLRTELDLQDDGGGVRQHTLVDGPQALDSVPVPTPEALQERIRERSNGTLVRRAR